jgi:DNA-binding PadR family transcriptional regulator
MTLEIQDGTPNRKVYTITAAGRACFAEALRTPVPFDRPKNPFLTRLFFFSHLSKAEQLAAAGQYLAEIEKMNEALEASRPEIEACADMYQNLCFNFGKRFYEDMVKNLSKVVGAIETA